MTQVHLKLAARACTITHTPDEGKVGDSLLASVTNVCSQQCDLWVWNCFENVCVWLAIALSSFCQTNLCRTSLDTFSHSVPPNCTDRNTL